MFRSSSNIRVNKFHRWRWFTPYEKKNVYIYMKKADRIFAPGTKPNWVRERNAIEPNKSNAGSNYMTIIYYLLMALFSLRFDDFQLEFSFLPVDVDVSQVLKRKKKREFLIEFVRVLVWGKKCLLTGSSSP